MIGRIALLTVVAVVVAACGGGSNDSLVDDLAATTQVVGADADVVEPVSKDRYGFVASTENRIDAFVIPAADVDVYGTYAEPRPAESVRFVRDPVARGALANVLDPATELVIMLIPLLDPTQELLIDFDARFIALDGSGAVVASDYDIEFETRLDELFALAREEGVDEAAALAAAAQALFDGSTDDFALRAARIIEG